MATQKNDNRDAKVIPNTFMTFNVHVDVAMQYLSGDEYKVLSFATRHVLGWQSNLHDRMGEISMSVFVDGYKSPNSDWQTGGCGLSEATVRRILNTLVEFKLLERIGKPSQKGQTWRIGESPDWDKLEARYDERQSKRKSVTTNATIASLAKRGLRHTLPLTSHVTPDPTSHVTPDPTSHVTHTYTALNPVSNPVSVSSSDETLSLPRKTLQAQHVVNPTPPQSVTMGALKTNNPDDVLDEIQALGYADKEQDEEVRKAIDKKQADERAKHIALVAWKEDEVAMYKAVLETFQEAGEYANNYVRMLRGEVKRDKRKADDNQSQWYRFQITGGKVWSDDLRVWAAWWRSQQQTDTKMLKLPDKISGSIEAWIALGKPKAGQKTGSDNHAQAPKGNTKLLDFMRGES